MNARQHVITEPARSHATERTTPIIAPRVADQLPPAARDLLHLASQVPDPHERRIAIDEAIDKVKARFPEFFHQPQPQE